MNFDIYDEYELRLNLHSKIMLAFRYGIAIEKEFVTAVFNGSDMPSNAQDSSERVKCKLKIEGVEVLAVMQDLMLVTALPISTIYNTPDAKSVAVGFDFALAMAPNLFTMQEIVDWREGYLHSNGGINKDDLRREIKKRAPDQRDPMEVLGLNDSFFDDVKELREMASLKSLDLALNGSEDLDWDFKGSKEEFEIYLKQRESPSERLKNLAKTELTTLYEETEDYAAEQKLEHEEYLNSDEYQREMQQEHNGFMRSLLIEELTRGEQDQQKFDRYFESDNYLNLDDISKAQKKNKDHEFMQKHNSVWVSRVKQRYDFIEQWDVYRQSSEYKNLDIDTKELKRLGFEEQLDEIYPLDRKKSEPTLGIPEGGELLARYNGKPVYYHGDCVVTRVVMNVRDDGWHAVHYENEKERFITATKQKFIADTYKAGQRGVWTISYDNGEVNYIQSFGGSPEKAGDFYDSPEWLKERYDAIKRSEGKCEACGSEEKLEVDHIMPRSRHPELELELSNLQVLCHKCNSGKGNTDTTDFRK
jgi:hypothetical protein